MAVTPASRPRGLGAAWVVALAAVLAAAVLAISAVRYLRHSPPPSSAVHFQIQSPESTRFGGPEGGGTGIATQLAVSPDGRHVVFRGCGGGRLSPLAEADWRPCGALASKHRGRIISFLVIRQPVRRILCCGKTEKGSDCWRAIPGRVRCAIRTRGHMGSRQCHRVRSGQPGAPSRFCCRGHAGRGHGPRCDVWRDWPSLAVFPAGRAPLPLHRNRRYMLPCLEVSARQDRRARLDRHHHAVPR